MFIFLHRTHVGVAPGASEGVFLPWSFQHHLRSFHHTYVPPVLLTT